MKAFLKEGGERRQFALSPACLIIQIHGLMIQYNLHKGVRILDHDGFSVN